MTTSEKVDRDAVEKFFTWVDPKKKLYFFGALAIVIGLMALSSKSPVFALVAVGAGILLIIKGRASSASFLKYYEAVKAAKSYDFDSVLRRSFKKTETDMDSLLDFDAQDLLSLDPESPIQPRVDQLAVLERKSVFLYGREDTSGRNDPSHHLRFVRAGSRVSAEYSPIFVSILYLTRSELIVYFANIDITRGDLRLEETSRVFLKDVVEIKTKSTSARMKRAENMQLFASYEKETRLELAAEIVRREHVIRVTKTDGRHLDLPVGAPEYKSGREGILDSETADEDRFTRVAREIFKRINDAKAGIREVTGA